jgi:hypothetical protein
MPLLYTKVPGKIKSVAMWPLAMGAAGSPELGEAGGRNGRGRCRGGPGGHLGPAGGQSRGQVGLGDGVRRWQVGRAAGAPAPAGSGLGRLKARRFGLHRVLGKGARASHCCASKQEGELGGGGYGGAAERLGRQRRGLARARRWCSPFL